MSEMSDLEITRLSAALVDAAFVLQRDAREEFARFHADALRDVGR